MIAKTATETRSGARQRERVLLLALAVIVSGAMGISTVLTRPLSFDGAINAQAALNLLERGRYGLGRVEIRDFDHRVQTGPTVVLPTALSLRLFGAGNSTLQLANLSYFVLFFVAAALYTYRHSGPEGALLAILLLAQTPRLGPLGLGLYGEVPALFFFLGGLLLLDGLESRPGVLPAVATGVLFGLAILTKIVMLIPVSAVALAVLVASIGCRPARLRHWAALAGGMVLPSAVFEAVKLLVLGPDWWVGWWAVMVRRIAGQGLPLGMPDTAGAVPKAATHLGILGDIVGVPAWTALLLLLVPTLLLALVRFSARASDGRGSSIPVSVVSLWLAATAFLGWWLVLTPTSRAWPRRVLIGLLLQELLISIVLIQAVRWVARRRRKRDRESSRAALWAVGTLAVLLLVSVATVLVANLPHFRLRTEPLPQRLAIETVAEVMRTRARDAVFYGAGWYRAPVLALLSGREIRDFNRFPIPRYGKRLRHTFFVVDNHLAGHQPQAMRKILARTVHHAVVQAGDCALYGMETVLPYPPIPEPDGIDDLIPVDRPKYGEYPFVGGLGREAPSGRYSDAVAGLLLDRGDRGCLLIDTWISPEAGERPLLEVRVDHRKVRAAQPVPGRPWKRLITLGEDSEPDTPGSLVELWLFIDRKEEPFSLWSGGKNTFVVREVGFVPCPGVGD